ncbi:hypothetical protein C8R44DRAFT_857911 [Mycena epipterygia]|nr:hypothetical protein C8R44DRAFT_857911 [Mycena epipterygia]
MLAHALFMLIQTPPTYQKKRGILSGQKAKKRNLASGMDFLPSDTVFPPAIGASYLPMENIISVPTAAKRKWKTGDDDGDEEVAVKAKVALAGAIVRKHPRKFPLKPLITSGVANGVNYATDSHEEDPVEDIVMEVEGVVAEIL